jgi:hypothetical protein
MPVIVGEHSAYTRVSRQNKIILRKRESIGTHAMHPPRKRESNNADCKKSIFENVRADTAVRPYAEDLSDGT